MTMSFDDGYGMVSFAFLSQHTDMSVIAEGFLQCSFPSNRISLTSIMT